MARHYSSTAATPGVPALFGARLRGQGGFLFPVRLVFRVVTRWFLVIPCF